MADEKDIPTYSYELIDVLDETVPLPELPKTAEGWAALTAGRLTGLAYASGYRALVERLIAQRAAQEEDHAERTGTRPDDAPEGNRGPLSHVRSISVGGFDTLGLREVEPMLDYFDNESRVSSGGSVAPPSDPFASFSDDDARRSGEDVPEKVADEDSST